jgi:hypothetical protein
MAKLTYAQRMRLKSSQFAEPTLRKYPIENEAHARNALARVTQFGTDGEKRIVRLAVAKKYPQIKDVHYYVQNGKIFKVK